MLHNPDLLDRISAYDPIRFDDTCYRATRRSLDPLTPSLAGGRWMVPQYRSVLYTSCTRTGAISELAFHLAQQSPLPTKPILVHPLTYSSKNTLRLARPHLEGLGIEWNRFSEVDYALTHQIGAVAAFLQYDGLIVPSARCNCENVIIFTDNEGPDTRVATVGEMEEVDWLSWARQNGLLPVENPN